MPSLILTRFRQGKRTLPFPETRTRSAGAIPRPADSGSHHDVRRVARVARTLARPTQLPAAERLQIDLGRCLFCSECANACPEGAIRFTSQYRLATSNRNDLLLAEGETLRLAGRLSRTHPPDPWPLTETPTGQRRWMQRMRGRRQCSEYRCFRSRQIRHSVCRITPTLGRTSDHRRHNSEHATGS